MMVDFKFENNNKTIKSYYYKNKIIIMKLLSLKMILLHNILPELLVFTV